MVDRSDDEFRIDDNPWDLGFDIDIDLGALDIDISREDFWAAGSPDGIYRKLSNANGDIVLDARDEFVNSEPAWRVVDGRIEQADVVLAEDADGNPVYEYERTEIDREQLTRILNGLARIRVVAVEDSLFREGVEEEYPIPAERVSASDADESENGGAK